MDIRRLRLCLCLAGLGLALLAAAASAEPEARRGGRRAKLQREQQQELKKEEDFRPNATSVHRQGKAFSLFNVVTFRNGPCQSTMSLQGSSNNRNGTCFTTTECDDKNGKAEGNCAAGFGVCCVFVVADANGGDINQNCSYAQNENYPTGTTTAGTYAYTINKCDNEICSVRLDFEALTLAGPFGTTEENACTDMLTVTGSTSQVIPTLCGENAGQHMYIDVDQSSSSSITLNVILNNANTDTRTWDIKVSQIECSNALVPPGGCLQYSSGLTGRIETYNFAGTTTHLPNQDYSHCIRPEAGFCCIQYQVCTDITDNTGFSLAAFDGAGTALDANTDTGCLNLDHIEIQGSANICDANLAVDNKYCGRRLNNVVAETDNNPVCDCSPPFFVHVFTDGNPDGGPGIANTGATRSRGACLEYSQVPCA